MMSWSNLDPDHYLGEFHKRKILKLFQNHEKIFSSNFIVGLPSLAYDIFLYKSKTKIQLLSDESQLKFFEDGIRGGLSFASERLTDTRTSGKTMFHWVRCFSNTKLK